MYLSSNIEALSRNHCRCGKTISVKYSECVFVALFLQHAERIRHIILSPVTYLPVQYTYFSTLSTKGHDFRENIIEDEMCVLMFSTAFVRKTFYSKNNSERNYHNST